MLKAERHLYILKKIQENLKIYTIDLALELEISEDTVRRDLNELHNKGKLVKVYGGAYLAEEKSTNIFDIHIVNEDKKYAVGNKALSLLSDGQVIIMSGGTTNLAFSKLIPSELKATIYTYSLPIAMQLSQHPNIELIFIGGKLQKNAMVTIGMDVIQMLSTIKADICFMGVSSINVQSGLTEKGYEVSVVKKAMIQVSDKVIAMVDSGKLDNKMSHTVCELAQLHAIITDLSPKDKKLQEYAASGVRLL
ncbi:MAG: DeoR/GlpR transcriptional regulator [Flavobacterium sp.]|nr:DeoR/GlpR transcriptional regulator [Flavobacterium sp.]